MMMMDLEKKKVHASFSSTLVITLKHSASSLAHHVVLGRRVETWTCSATSRSRNHSTLL